MHKYLSFYELSFFCRKGRCKGKPLAPALVCPPNCFGEAWWKNTAEADPIWTLALSLSLSAVPSLRVSQCKGMTTQARIYKETNKHTHKQTDIIHNYIHTTHVDTHTHTRPHTHAYIHAYIRPSIHVNMQSSIHARTQTWKHAYMNPIHTCKRALLH